MKNKFFVVSIILILNSCCPYSCDCYDTPREVLLAFDTNKATGFQIQDIDTVALISLGEDLKIIETSNLFLDLKTEHYLGLESIKFGFDLNHKFRTGGNYIRNYNVITQNLDTFFVRNLNITGHDWSDKNCKKSTCFIVDKKTLTINNNLANLSDEDSTIFLRKK